MKVFALVVGLVAAQQQNLGWVYVVDDGGPDDQVDQSDLNYMGFNKDNPLYAEVTWSWDDTIYPGSNSGDACSLWDLNKNGLVDFALCTRINSIGPSDVTLTLTQLFDCRDTQAANCPTASQPGYSNPQNSSEMTSATGGGGTKLKSYCKVDFMEDPFKGQHTTTQQNPVNDTRAFCRLYYSDLTEKGVIQPGDPQLLNVCSYPSSSPTSNFKDCVVVAGTGFLIINKWTNEAQGCRTITAYGYDCEGDNAESTCQIYECDNVPREIWNFTYSQSGVVKKTTSVMGWGWSSMTGLLAGSYAVSEGTLPSGWVQVGFRCADNQTNSNAVTIYAGQTLVCYFVNYHGTLQQFVDTYGNFSDGTANITLQDYDSNRTFAPTPVPAPTSSTSACPTSLTSLFILCDDTDFEGACATSCVTAANVLQIDVQTLSVAVVDECIGEYHTNQLNKTFSFGTIDLISSRLSATPPQPICTNGKQIVLPPPATSTASSVVSAAFVFFFGICLLL